MNQALPALLLFACVFLAFQVQRCTSEGEGFWRLLGACLPTACVFLLLGVGLTGRAFGSFGAGLWGGLILSAGAGFFFAWKNRGQALSFRLGLGWRDLPWLGFVILSTVGIAWVAWQYAMHDERMVQGHASLTEALLRGTYPLYFLPFPEIPNKYHIGFDIFAAVFSQATGLPGYRGVDLATVFLWVALLLGLTELLSRMKVPRALLGAGLMLVVFTGGLGWILGGSDAVSNQIPAWQYLSIAGRWVHYHFVFYFYQHPMALGAVIFVGTLDWLRRWFETERKAFLGIATLSLGALSLAHVMFFATLLATLAAFFAVRLVTHPSAWKKNLVAPLALGVAAVVLAFALGGFFQLPSPNFAAETAKIAWPPGYLRYEYFGAGKPMTAWQALLWYLHSFGIFLVFLPWALLRAWREKKPFISLLAGYCLLSLLIPQLFYYAYSSNIQKWFLSFEFSGKILCAAMLLPLAARPLWRTCVAWGLILGAGLTPFNFIYGLTFKPPSALSPGERQIRGVRHSTPQGAFLEVVNRLKQNGPPHRVWASGGLSRVLALYTGFPVLEIDNLVAMPVAREKLERRRKEIAALFSTPNLDLLKELDIRWALFSCAEEAHLPVAVRSFLESLKAMPGFEDLSVRKSETDCYVLLKIPGV